MVTFLVILGLLGAILAAGWMIFQYFVARKVRNFASDVVQAVVGEVGNERFSGVVENYNKNRRK